MMLSQDSKKSEWLSKKRQMQGAQGRGMRRTQVRRSDESNCSNAAVGEFLRRHQELDMGRMRRLGIFACNLNPRKHMLPRTLIMPFDQPMLPGWNPNLI
jgi:hypothetical protein